MQKKLIFWTILLFAIFQQTIGREKNVLILHSYNSGLSWTDRINDGIFESFKDQYHRTIDLRCEFMDSKHFESQDYFQHFKDYLTYKYAKIPIDLIICSDNPAFDFLSLYHNELFKEVPVVFCGLNYCDSIPKGFTGIMEDIDLYSNLKLITTIHPNYGKLYIINDKSITGRSISKELNKVLINNFQKLNYEFLSDYTLKELEHKLSTLKPNDIVFLLLFNFDRTGVPYSYDVILDEILPYCKVPVYGAWNFYLGKGIVGGKITDAYDHGLMVSSIAKDILAGKKITDIRVKSGPSRYIFDYQVLKTHNISHSLLPSNAEIINQPYDFILRNKQFFILLAIIIVLLIAIIGILYRHLQKVRYSLSTEQDLVTRIEENSAALETALEKAEESSRLKSRFLANISHEIRTPMNGILGFSDLLTENQEPAQQKNYIKIIHECGKQLLNIINDILDISIIESQQITICKETVSLNQTIDGLCSVISNQPTFGNKKFIKSYAFPNDDDLISTDGTKLRQILSNILSNASKFAEQGTIHISYRLISNYIEFVIKDEGIGISEQNQKKIFERFWQVEHNNSILYGGNGLGLAISKANAEALGGKIWVESILGQGSSFFFTIPYSKVVLTLQNKPDFSDASIKIMEMVILVVEDDENNFLFLKELLSKYVKEIIHAQSGEVAIEQIKKRNDINLILMDLKLPGLDGYSTTGIIHSINKDIPIIAQSAFTSSDEKIKALNAGCSDFITKPIEKTQLFNKIEKLMNISKTN